MIECPNCHQMNDGNRTGQPCVQCKEPLPGVAEDGGEANHSELDKFDVIVEPVPSTDQKDQAEQRKREQEKAPGAVTVQEEEDKEQLDPDLLDAITEYGRARAIVSVIGYSNSGKTFFVNRLRDQLAKAGWRRSPSPAQEVPQSPLGIELTRFVPTDIRPRKGRNYTYMMADCAGESFRQALQRNFKTDRLDGVQGRSYLAAIAFAKAYVIVIRADDLLGLSEDVDDGFSGSEKDQKTFIKNMANRFDDIINTIVVSKERVRPGEEEQFLRDGLSPDDLKGALERNQVRCSQPLCIAFSLADQLSERGEDYDVDPFLFALRHAPALVKAVDRTFNHYRFDFLSAFYDHNTYHRPDYRKPSYGALESFLWLHEMLKPRSMISRLGRFASGAVPTRKLVALRCKMDPVFDREWRDAWNR